MGDLIVWVYRCPMCETVQQSTAAPHQRTRECPTCVVTGLPGSMRDGVPTRVVMWTLGTTALSINRSQGVRP